MGHPALNLDIHPDQALLDDCQQWHIDIKEYYRLAEAGDDTASDAFYSAHIAPVKERIIATRANSSEGRVAKASVFKADYGKELADTDEYLEQFAASLCDDMIAEAGSVPSPDQALFDLCRRCVEALAANDAIYEAVPRGVDISDEVSDKASAHYDAEVVPLLSQIEVTPTTTLAGFVAKSRVLMHDGFDVYGEDHICGMGAVMLNDLSGLNLVPEVPEAPHSYEVIRSTMAPAAQEAA